MSRATLIRWISWVGSRFSAGLVPTACSSSSKTPDTWQAFFFQSTLFFRSTLFAVREGFREFVDRLRDHTGSAWLGCALTSWLDGDHPAARRP
jgi:hypothetical protein